jgi:hypothetical protein
VFGRGHSSAQRYPTPARKATIRLMNITRIRVKFVGGPQSGVVERELGARDFSPASMAYRLYLDDPTLACKWLIAASGETPHYYKVATAKEVGELLELTCEYGGTEHPTDHAHD